MNKEIEAYTGKSVGHRTSHLVRRQVSPVSRLKAVGDDVSKSESNTKDSNKVRVWRDRRGFKPWHAGRGETGTWEARFIPPKEVGASNERRSSDDETGVRPAHSTQEGGKRLQGEGAGWHVKPTQETASGRKILL